jgi:hypothetical protein
MSVRALHSILTVAIASEPLSYTALRLREDEPYNFIASSIALLSDGRGKQKGANLLLRVPGVDRRSKCVTASAKAEAHAIYLASIFGLTNRHPRLSDDACFAQAVIDNIRVRILPALREILKVDPNMNITTLSVFLFICCNNQNFGHLKWPTKAIAEELNITNLPRNVSLLSSGLSREPGLELIALEPDPDDYRVMVPFPTEKGAELVASITGALEAKEHVSFSVEVEPLKVLKNKKRRLRRTPKSGTSTSVIARKKG